MSQVVLAIDQGTTSSRAILFDAKTNVIATAQQEFQQHFPKPGWVEHTPADIWDSVLSTARNALKAAALTGGDVAAIGITNQRETVVVWERATGKPLYNAIVWQDRRTADICASLKNAGHEPDVLQRTGLPLDPYFSATKLAWILDHVPGARARAERGELAAGTIDTFLLWKLTGGKVHATDATNASRTALFNIHTQTWDEALLGLFQVPLSLLPRVKDCTGDFGDTAPELFGKSIVIRGIAGDQQAAALGQACFAPGMLKSTYGTGCFALLNTGSEAITSSNRLLTTVASRIDGHTTYALEGSIYIAGAGLQWLRDGLEILPHAEAAEAMAEAADLEQEIVLVPAFVGLGAPYWDPNCRGAIFGLTRNTGRNEIVKATLESVCFQTVDLITAMQRDWPDMKDIVLRVDGGMSASNWTMQRLADLLDCTVERPKVRETTALGAAYLAGLSCGFFPSQETFAATWELDQRFNSTMKADTRKQKLSLWHSAITRTLSHTHS